MVYFDTTAYGKNEYGKSGHSTYFHFCETFNDAFEVLEFRTSFLHHITDTANM